jgi:hypothetical protein
MIATRVQQLDVRRRIRFDPASVDADNERADGLATLVVFDVEPDVATREDRLGRAACAGFDG